MKATTLLYHLRKSGRVILNNDAKHNFINTVKEYLLSGETAENELSVGMELEHFVVKPCDIFIRNLIKDQNLQPVFYSHQGSQDDSNYSSQHISQDNCHYNSHHSSPDKSRVSGPNSISTEGIEKILKLISSKFPTNILSEEHLIGLGCSDYTITLEPSAQLEVSISPVRELYKASIIYNGFKRLIGPILDRFGFRLANYGYSPCALAYESPMIPKQRYEYMDRYFKTSGSMGINMMRATASTQISVDYSHEKDFVNKYRAAYILSPVLKYICDNTPIFEKQENHKLLKRTEIWHNVDEERCRMPEGVFDDDFGYESYAKYLWNTPAIYIPKNEADLFERKQDHYVGNKTMGELWTEGMLGPNDMEFIMSMVFPDVRLKSFIEIRYADSLPFNEALGYMAMIKGLFYNRDNLDWVLSHSIGAQEILRAEGEIMEYREGAKYMGLSIEQLVNKLFDMALIALPEEEKEFLLPLKTRKYENESLF